MDIEEATQVDTPVVSPSVVATRVAVFPSAVVTLAVDCHSEVDTPLEDFLSEAVASEAEALVEEASAVDLEVMTPDTLVDTLVALLSRNTSTFTYLPQNQ